MTSFFPMFTPTIQDDTLSLHDALPISDLIGDIEINGYKDLLNPELKGKIAAADPASSSSAFAQLTNMLLAMGGDYTRSEEHTSELQSRGHLVCRLLLAKKNNMNIVTKF